MDQHFCAAVQALTSPSSAPEHRKAAEEWLMQFQQSDEGWPVALQLLSSSQPPEVQTFAAQALKRKAWMSRSSGKDVLKHMQRDLLQALASNQQLSLQTLRQVILALVGSITPALRDLDSLLKQLSDSVRPRTTLLFLETLAEEIGGLQPYGPGQSSTHVLHTLKTHCSRSAGSAVARHRARAHTRRICTLSPCSYTLPSAGSSDDRAQSVSDIKACLRSVASGPMGWLARLAGQSTQPGDTPADTLEHHIHILKCFQAWIRLGTLHELSQEDGQHLVGLALQYLDSLDSPVR